MVMRTLTGPYVGDYRGASWNAQGFFATRAGSHAAKRRFLAQLLTRADFVMLSETHGTAGSQAAFTDIPETRAFWSAGTAARGGVGIIIKLDFLRRFSADAPCWTELVQGRVGRLSLRGPDGALDLFTVYFPTGTRRRLDEHSASQAAEDLSLRQQREELAVSIRSWLRPSAALAIVAGDFNFVPAREDRFHKPTGEFSGGRDAGEAAHWCRLFDGPSLLYEQWQPEATHDGPMSRARLDRVYTNQPVCDQLDRLPFAAALGWCPRLSQHRPLAFGRLSRPPNPPGEAAIPEGVIRSEEWPTRVAADFHARLRLRGTELEPLDRLATLKTSIREVSKRMRGEAAGGSPATPPDASDELGVVMGALRRLERVRWLWVPKFAARSPALRDALSQQLVDDDPGAASALLRPIAVDLARRAVRVELEDLQATMHELDPEVVRRRRVSILQRIRRLAPGRAAAVTALEDVDGSVQVDPAEVARILRRHWGEVFAARRLQVSDIASWLREDLAAPDGLAAALRPLLSEPELWRVRRVDVVRAIERTSRSAPGPDGIPYAAWRRLGPLAHDSLFAAAEVLESEAGQAALGTSFPRDPDGRSAFNEAIMVFLPKKDPLVSEAGVAYTRAEEVRPLSIVNTDNRLLANALRLRIEPLLEAAVSRWQQGFLAGRSLLKNVVDVDAAMREVALGCDEPAAVFYDFQAAFPSLSHEFLLRMLGGLGLPLTVCRFVECLYWGHGCRLSAGGQLHEGFSIRAGIRQGCPLSPLLFAVVVDPLLRRLHRELPAAVVRAYADDLVTVVPSLAGALPTLVPLFCRFAGASGLQLNFRKVVIVPLGDRSLEQVARDIAAAYPTWGQVQCRHNAKYLGFMLGPGRAELGWAAALDKAVARARLWAAVALGLQFAALVFRVYVASTLSFLLQLENLPSGWSVTEGRLFRLLVPGPFNWCTPADLHGLRRDFGFPQEFVDLRVVALAAKLRVLHQEARAQGGLRCQAWLQRLAEAERASEHVVRQARWRAWLQSSFCHELTAASDAFRRLGITFTAVQLRAAKGIAPPWSPNKARQVAAGIQHAAGELLMATEQRFPEARMRAKLERWEVPLFPRLRAQRAMRVLRRLSALVPPRVLAAVLRTWWSGWCTARRFGKRASCLFCGSAGWDSVEHASVCRVLAHFGAAHLRLPHFEEAGARRLGFLLLGPPAALSNAQLTLGALRMAAAYRTHCRFRRSRAALQEAGAVQRALAQAVRELVQGHPGAIACYDARWTR